MSITVGRVGRGAHNVGRPTPLGNPYFMRDESVRDEVCDKYEIWFAHQIEVKNPRVMEQLRALYRAAKQEGDITLGCYCAPRRCHADTIARFLRNYAD